MDTPHEVVWSNDCGKILCIHFRGIIRVLLLRVIGHNRNHRPHKALKQQRNHSGGIPQKRFLQNQNRFHKSPLYPGVSYPLCLSR